jgi:hypothetical protein
MTGASFASASSPECDDQAPVLPDDGNDRVLDRHLLRDEADDFLLDLVLPEVREGQPPVLREPAAHGLLVAGRGLHEGLADPDAVRLSELESLGDLAVIDRAHGLEDLPKGVLVHTDLLRTRASRAPDVAQPKRSYLADTRSSPEPGVERRRDRGQGDPSSIREGGVQSIHLPLPLRLPRSFAKGRELRMP